MGASESKIENATGLDSTEEFSSLSSSASMSTLQKRPKKKRESHLIANSMTSKTLERKLGLPEDQDLAMPPEEEFITSFIELLDELALPQAKREVMMQMSAERKWTLLLQQRGREYIMKQVSNNPKSKNTENSRKPEEFVSLIRDPNRKVSDLTALEVSLRSEKISWVSEFLVADGLNCLLDLLSEYEIKDSLSQNEVDILSKTILCMKALMNNSISLKSVLEDERSINLLVLTLKNATVKMKTQILELLAAICFVPPDGLQFVLTGFMLYKEQNKEYFRFQTLLNDLRSISNVDFQISCMSLFNAIVNSTDDLEFRVHLRNELLDLRIEEIIEELRGPDNDDLNTQLNIFEDEALSDEETIASRYGVMNINMTDPDEIYRAIRALVSDTSSYSWFLRTIQQLLLIPASRKLRVHYWRLIYTIVAQVVLQREGIDPDLCDFDLDVEAIINGFVRQEEFEKTKTLLSDIEKQVVQQDRELKQTQEELRKKDEEHKELQKKMETQSKELRIAIQSAAAAKYKLAAKEEEGFAIKPDIFNWEEVKITPNMKAEDVKKLLIGYVTGTMEKSIEIAKEESLKRAKEEEAKAAAEFGVAEEPKVDTSAPPPPPPPDFGPPPPPPPGPPGPPPPPGMGPIQSGLPTSGPLGLPLKPKITPSVKMKALHWAKLPDMQLSNTFWSTPIDDQSIRAAIDIAALEEKFQAKEGGIRKNQDNSEKKKEKTEISVIESKRAYNISIMLSRVRLTFPEIRQAILGMEEGLLTEQMLKNFIEYLPATEEYEALAIYMHGDASKNLGLAEQFFVEMMKIERYEQRLKSLHFKRRFQERIDELFPSIEAVIICSNQLKTSQKLRRVLEIILAIGNYMNAGTMKGSAYGYKISLLSKLGDTKAGDNKFTLMHYLHKTLQTKFSGYENLREELTHLDQASKVNVNSIIAELNDLKGGINMIQSELQHHKNAKKGDEFYPVMKTFVERASKTFETVEQRFLTMNSNFEVIVQFFGENVKDTPPDIFFGMFSLFLSLLEKAGEDNKLEEERKRLADKRAEQENSKKKKARPRGAAAAIDDDSRNVMDDLVAAIRSGAVFDRNDNAEKPKSQGATRDRKSSNAAVAAVAAAALKRKETRKGLARQNTTKKSST